MNCDLDTSVPEWLIEHPEVSRLFNELRLDVSCGGKSLRYVCQQQDLAPEDVLRQLRNIIGQ